MTAVAYAGLIIDGYPPFRLDPVGHRTGGTLVVPPPTAPAGSAAPVSAAPIRPAGPDSALTGGRLAVPAGGRNMPWSVTVGYTEPAGRVLTVVVSAGGHIAEVERLPSPRCGPAVRADPGASRPRPRISKPGASAAAGSPRGPVVTLR